MIDTECRQSIQTVDHRAKRGPLLRGGVWGGVLEGDEDKCLMVETLLVASLGKELQSSNSITESGFGLSLLNCKMGIPVGTTSWGLLL